MTAYYNEFDPFAAQWLRNLIAKGLIAPGDVDERSINDVHPDDLRPYVQCHFFAGIGVWSAALRRIGWPDDRPIWSGSCSCQPFSAAGKGAGFADERHVWPAFFHLITALRPVRIVGEQVSSKDGLAWFDLIQADLEGADYASGAVDLCSASVGAPNIRQRGYWMAYANDAQRGSGSARRDQRDGADAGWRKGPGHAEGRCGLGGLADPQGEGGRGGLTLGNGGPSEFGRSGDVRPSGLADQPGGGRGQECPDARRGDEGNGAQGGPARFGGGGAFSGPCPNNGFWGPSDWLLCRDPDGPKWRPVEPWTFPLASGAPARMGRLRAYGNAVNLEVAAAFLDVAAEVMP